MGTVGVPERYALPREGQIVEIRYLYCHPEPMESSSSEVFRQDSQAM
jgi:hypothetical protein